MGATCMYIYIGYIYIYRYSINTMGILNGMYIYIIYIYIVGTVNGIFDCDIEWDVAGNYKRWQYDDMAIVECTPEKDAEKVNCTTDLSRTLLLLYLFQGCCNRLIGMCHDS
jgi:hypothetical protein